MMPDCGLLRIRLRCPTRTRSIDSPRLSVEWCRLLLFVGFLASILHVSSAVDLSTCNRALGMQSDAIPDSAIRASSSYDDSSVGPANARIRTERNGGAWCPKQPISRDAYEWLEIDLQEVKVVTQVETQGRFGNGQGQEFAEAYMLQYKRLDTGEWTKFRDRKFVEILQGNLNPFVPEQRNISPPIIARKIRIIPYSTYMRTICMRVELYGCPWKDGVLSYSMPQGEKRGPEVDLGDATYDGKISDGKSGEPYLSGGLGQLMDGVEGHSNFRFDPDNSGRKGYDWVGWKNDSGDVRRPPIQIVFDFDRIRNFSSVWLHSNNMFSKDIRVFRKAMLYFSTGPSGSGYQNRPVVYEYMRDELIEFARNVIIPIPNRIAQTVRVDLYFDAKWMMISEVKFDSEIVTGNFTEEPNLVLPATYPDIPEKQDTPGVDPGPAPTDYEETDQSADLESKSDLRGSTTTRPLDERLVGVVIGGTAVAILLLIGGILFCILRRRYSRKKYVQYGAATRADMCRPTGPGFRPATCDPALLGRSMQPSMSGTVGNGKLLSNGILYNSVETCDDAEEGETRLIDGQVVIVSGGPGIGNMYREPFDGIQLRKLPDPPVLPRPEVPEYFSDTATSTYAVPDAYAATLSIPLEDVIGPAQSSFKPFPSGGSPPPLPPPPHPRDLYSGNGAMSLQGCSGNSCYALPVVTPVDMAMWLRDADPPAVIEFPPESLRFIERLGEGPYGEVHLSELRGGNVPDLGGSMFPVGNTSLLVTVKTLRSDADEKARFDFQREVMTLRCLNDPNVVRLIGIVPGGGRQGEPPPCIVTEYMQHGDLKQYLQRHRPQEGTLTRGTTIGINSLSYGCLIYMATQIASGMKYLETLNVVHRDLAARNCLVGELYTVKISDFGMSRPLHSADYYCIEGKAVLPIRWMAWESVLLGKFSTKSDIWSFAVTLWEVLNLCRSQPFGRHDDEAVIENCRLHYISGSGAPTPPPVHLPQPANCPKEIYDLMRECWQRDDTLRPSFREVHMFLLRKNMGYSPHDDCIASSSATVSFV